MVYSASKKSGRKPLRWTAQHTKRRSAQRAGSGRARSGMITIQGYLTAVFSGACFLALSGLAVAKEFTIHNVQTTFSPKVLSVKARIDLSLSEEVVDALHNGIPIKLSTTIEMSKIRRFLPDPKISEWRFNYDLSYHGLSHRYVLDSPFDDEPISFSQLQSALNRIGDFNFQTELVSETLPQSEQGYSMSLESELDINALPAPLRLIALILPAWRLNSEPYQWREPN